MSEKERDGDAGDLVGRKPLRTEPAARPESQPVTAKFPVQLGDLAFEPGALDPYAQVADAYLEEFVVGEAGPVGSAFFYLLAAGQV